MDVTKPKVASCNNEPVMNPKELLPSDSEWSNVAPTKGLENVSFLSAGHNFGTNTVGSSLRNANLTGSFGAGYPKGEYWSVE